MPQRAIEAERRRESRMPKREGPWSELLSAASDLGVVAAPEGRSRAERLGSARAQAAAGDRGSAEFWGFFAHT